MKEEKEELKDFVNGEVYEKVNNALTHYKRADQIHKSMENVEKAQEVASGHQINQWSLRLEINHMTSVQFDDKHVLKGEIWETIQQFLNLLEAIHYSERKQTIIDFNNSLKNSNDGKNTSK